ncbi:MAG: phenylacetate--CoA ligase, partial [Notoacmeibacter sp.]|nr:phenylacetate--CoA ligase [Notoacmeibacter sp.]
APHFQIELITDGRMDAMIVHTEALETHAHDDARKASAGALNARIKDVVGVTTKIVVADPGGIERSMGKAVRVKDSRSRS